MKPPCRRLPTPDPDPDSHADADAHTDADADADAHTDADPDADAHTDADAQRRRRLRRPPRLPRRRLSRRRRLRLRRVALVREHGVPAGTKLTVSEGNLTVTTPNAVLDSLDIRGFVQVNAPGVVIKNSIVRGRDTAYDKGLVMVGSGAASPSRTLS